MNKQYIFFFLLSLFSSTAFGEVCLPLEREIIELNGIHDFSDVKISPVGDHILYKNERKSVILFDLETKERTEISNHKHLKDKIPLEDTYGFSKDGSLVWALFQESLIKIKNFLQKTTTTLPLISEEEMVMITHMSEDRSKLFSFSLSKDFIEKANKVEEEVKNLSLEEAHKVQEEFIKQTVVNLNVLNMESLEQTVVVAFSKNLQFNNQCAVLKDNMMAAVVRRDGSLYLQPLSEKKEAPIEVFGPIEGIRIVSYGEATLSIDTLGLSSINCGFLDKNTVLIYNEKEDHYILRRIKEQEQYIINQPSSYYPNFSTNILYYPFHFDFSRNILYYPFLIQSTKKGTSVYHIPSGQSHSFKDHYMRIGKGGQFAIELVILEDGQKVIKAVHLPFDSSKRRILFEMDMAEVKHISFNEDKSLAFIGNILGDLFIIDVETGYIKRHFFGQQFRGFKISDSGNSFLLQHPEEGVFSYKAHRIQERCVQPVSSFSGGLENQFRKFAELDDRSEDYLLDLLALLTGVLQEEKIVKKHSKLIQPLLWKILLYSPGLYLDLHFRYPSLKLLPPFPASFVKDQKTQFLLREAVLSILEMQTQFRYTQFSHWRFLLMLESVLYVLSEEEQNLYIEKITESISNEATKQVFLFQDVFQSKLYYVIYSHVKSWFGRDYKAVSDITIVRKKSGFLTLILSSESIPNHSSVETAFGIHYAVVEDFSMGMAPSEVEAGQELVNDVVEWNILKGPSYRAHLRINVQDQYEFKNQKGIPIITRKAGPDYESVWKDQKMTGLVIIGSSLRSFSKVLVENYLSYFKEQGFQFSEVLVPDFHPFLKEKIGNCEVDYFLKESHSDGDERNVFRFDRINHVLKGLRQTEGGKEEVIYLAFPKPFHFGKRETLLFSNLELAELVKQREEKGCGEITYFNTSCWAHVKARYEIETVHSHLLLNIPSKSLSDTFLNQEGDAIYELIQAYRKGLNFNGFRKSLEKNEGYRSGKVNQYLFPDQRQYYNFIFQHISIPLKIQIDLEREENGEWMPISPDEAL